MRLSGCCARVRMPARELSLGEDTPKPREFRLPRTAPFIGAVRHQTEAAGAAASGVTGAAASGATGAGSGAGAAGAASTTDAGATGAGATGAAGAGAGAGVSMRVGFFAMNSHAKAL